MKRTCKTVVILLALTALSGAVAYIIRSFDEAPLPPAATGDEGDRLRGRDFVVLGKPAELAGTLLTEFGEWFLAVNGIIHELHLGDHAHRADTGIKLEEGKPAEVTGFLYAREGDDTVDVAVCVISLDGEEYRFREDDGTPLWRGRGSGPGRQQRAESPAF